MDDILATPEEPIKPAQTDAPPTEPTSWMPLTDEMRQNAPENIRTLLENKKWDSLDKMADGYIGLEKMQGVGEHLVIPDAEDADGWGDVYKTLGRPDTADAYEVNLDGEPVIDDALTSEFKTYAHSLGLSQKQFNDIVKFQVDSMSAQEQIYNEQAEQTKIEAVDALKQEYGVQYDAKVSQANKLALDLGIYDTLKNKGLASDPDIIKMLAGIASRSEEDTLTPQTQTPTQKTPQEELAEIKLNPAFTDKFHRDHKKVMADFMRVNMQIANSGQSQMPKAM